MKIKVEGRTVWLLVEKKASPGETYEKWYGFDISVIAMILFYLFIIIVMLATLILNG